jgi:hypothetical protein
MAELDDVEAAMLRHDDPVVTASNLADALDEDVTSRHVLDLLRLLERAGDVESKKIGARAVAWWHVDRVCPPRLPPEEQPDQRALDDGPDFEPRESAHARGDEAPAEDVDRRPEADVAAFDALETPAMTDSEEDHRRAVFAIYDLLREEPRTRGQVQDELHEEFTAGYQNERTWWRRVAKPALEEHPDVKTPSGGADPWRFVE